MAKNEWYRRSTWAELDEREFFERLGRSRDRFHRAQYLRTQAGHLNEAGLHAEALRLLDHLIGHEPEPNELAWAHEDRAETLEVLGRNAEALSACRSSLVAEKAFPNVQTRGPLRFARLVVDRRREDLYPEALEALDFFGKQAQPFAVDRFQLAAYRAILLFHQGEISKASTWARAALEVSQEAHSGLARHPAMGLVKEDDPLLERVAGIAMYPPDQELLAAIEDAKLPSKPEERALVLELREAGYQLDSIWDWVNKPSSLEAEEILARHLEKAKDETFVEGIARALSDPRFRTVTELLIKKFCEVESDTVRWAIGDSISRKRFTKDLWNDLLRIAADKSFGIGRQWIVARLHRIKRPGAEDLLLQLLEDEDVDAFAAGALRYCGGRQALEKLRSLDLTDRSPLMKRETAKAIKKLEAKL